MNLVDCIVTEVLDKPEFKYSKWFVKVKYDCYGGIWETEIMVDTEEEANKIDVGYKFLS